MLGELPHEGQKNLVRIFAAEDFLKERRIRPNLRMVDTPAVVVDFFAFFS